MRYGLTHPPVSNVAIIFVSPLHNYLLVFRLFMLLIYHLNAELNKWTTTSPLIQTLMHQMRDLLLEKPGFHIYIPSCNGGNDSTKILNDPVFLTKKISLRSPLVIFSHVSIVCLYKVIQNGPIFIGS